MTAALPSPEIHAVLNDAGELELTPAHAPDGAVIRVDLNADSSRMLCTQGQYLAPIQAPPGTRIRYRLFTGKKGIGEPETFVMPGIPSISPVPSTLVPCTQNRDFLIYDWPARHEAVCRLVRETHPDLLFIGDSITHFWGGNPVDEPHRDILQKSPETWAACTEGMRAANLGFGYDRVENVLWRLRHGELDGAAADAVCVVLIGTNNFAENTDEEIRWAFAPYAGKPGTGSPELPSFFRDFTRATAAGRERRSALPPSICAWRPWPPSKVFFTRNRDG